MLRKVQNPGISSLTKFRKFILYFGAAKPTGSGSAAGVKRVSRHFQWHQQLVLCCCCCCYRLKSNSESFRRCTWPNSAWRTAKSRKHCCSTTTQPRVTKRTKQWTTIQQSGNGFRHSSENLVDFWRFYDNDCETGLSTFLKAFILI